MVMAEMLSAIGAAETQRPGRYAEGIEERRILLITMTSENGAASLWDSLDRAIHRLKWNRITGDRGFVADTIAHTDDPQLSLGWQPPLDHYGAVALKLLGFYMRCCDHFTHIRVTPMAINSEDTYPSLSP